MSSRFSNSANRLLLGVGALSAGLVGSIVGQSINPLDQDETGEERLPAMEMLIEGSVLQGVMIPQYDDAKRLSSVMRAVKLTMVREGLIDAETLRIDFYNPDRSPKGRIDLETATLLDQQILRSEDPVALVSDELNLKGSGLVYELKESRGFLLGPAKATAFIETRTSMNLRRPTLRAAAGLTMVGAAAVATTLEKIPEEELDQIDQLAKPTATQFEKAAESTGADVAETLENEKRMDETVDEFLNTTEGLEEAAKAAAAASSIYEPVPAPPKEEVSFETTTLKVDCDEGIFFDNSENFVSFLRNVQVDYPGFKLTNADELKVSFASPAADDGTEEETNGGERSQKISVGDPQTMIATGPVVIDFESEENGRRGQASARQVVYDFVNETITLRGGNPWIVSDSLTGQITEAEGYFRIDTVTGDIQAVGTVKGIYEDRKTGDPYTPDNLEKTNFKATADANKPTVFVIGDSISIGYTLPLREKLKGSHNVLRPINKDGTPFNTGNTNRILQNLDGWLNTTKPDVVVFNSGMWDIAASDKKDPSTTSIPSELYAQNLRKIIARLKKSDARLIWASTTFVPKGATLRDDANVVAFNRIAEEIMKEEGVEIIDLYTPTKDMPTSKRLGSRNVHYMGSGSAILAEKVASKITDESQ